MTKNAIHQPNSLSKTTSKMSTALRRALDSRVWEDFNGVVIRGEPTCKTPELHREAETLLKHFDVTEMRPLIDHPDHAKKVKELALQVGAIVLNPPSSKKLNAWIVAVTTLSEDIPIGAWTHDFIKDVIRSFKFMPTPPEIDGILRNYTTKLKDKRAKITLFLRAPIPQPKPKRQRPTEAEIRAVEEMVTKAFPTLRQKEKTA